MTFSTRKQTCSLVTLNGQNLSSRRYQIIRASRSRSQTKLENSYLYQRKELGLQLKKIYWLLGCKSQLLTENKLLLYKTILKLYWSYGIQLWSTVSNTNIEILQRIQHKFLRIAFDASWCVTIDSAPWYTIRQRPDKKPQSVICW